MAHSDGTSRLGLTASGRDVRWQSSVASQHSDHDGPTQYDEPRKRRTPRLGRLLQIREMLSHAIPINIDTLASRFQVASRTIYRDLNTLIEAGVPIVYNEDRRGYILTCPSSKSVRFTHAHILGLLLTLASAPVQAFPSPAAAVVELLPKLMDGLHFKQRLELQAVIDALPIAERCRHASGATSQLLEQILEGVMHQHDMRLNYRITLDGPSASTRITAPYHLSFINGNWCIEARSSQHRRRRQFSLERLASIEVLSSADRVFTANGLNLTIPSNIAGEAHSIS